MQKDCEIYVDPEEDEVFFGCISEREKSVCAKLVKCTESNFTDCKVNTVSQACEVLTIDEDNNENVVKNEQSTKVSNEIIINDVIESVMFKELDDSLEDVEHSNKIPSANSSVELEHNYSTPVKHKIDKSILTTPKSIVKADRDGGFLKVLSEIALVKAEVEGDNESYEKKEDEDKENKVIQPLPEIRITEATPEKGSVLSPPKNVNTERRRFRIIYNLPNMDDNIENKTKSRPESFESFESERNFKNKCLDQEEVSSNESKKEIDLIDFNNSVTSIEDALLEEDSKENQTTAHTIPYSSAAFPSFKDESSVNEIITVPDSPEDDKLTDGEVKSPPGTEANISKPHVVTSQPSKSLRFSKEARKIVEVLKNSTVDDTLNFTIPEVDLETEENSFLSPEPLSAFDDTLAITKILNPEQTPSKVVSQSVEHKAETKACTVEKDRHKLTPVVSQSKLRPLKYFSERRVNTLAESEVSRCVKKLPMEEKKPVAAKINGVGAGDSNVVPVSRIPVFGSKNSKIPVNDRIGRTLPAKTIPSKTPIGKGHKNPKFNHIESPINAYIHNKPTSLVLNVKPEPKKDCLSKIWKVQTGASAKKNQQKTSASASNVRLPFVEYKSATPFKIEKRPESRLPRLAPNVMKLIGPHSPKVLRHEGRFYMNTPRKPNLTENSTIIAEPNEVSVVLSHPAQKSHTIK